MNPGKCPKNVPSHIPPDRSCEAFGVVRCSGHILRRASESQSVPPVWTKNSGWGGGFSGGAAVGGEIGRGGAWGAEGKPGGRSRRARGVIPRRHKSLSTHMSFFGISSGVHSFLVPCLT